MSDFSTTNIMDLAAIVAEHLHQHGIEIVLVGGLAVEIYTQNRYLTKDIDMVNINYQPPQRLSQAMSDLGFHKQGRVYVNDTTEITVEFPAAPLSVGEEIIKQTTVAHVSHGTIPILRVEDVVKDRLAAYIHWQDNQSLIQATAIMLQHGLQPTRFHEFCTREGSVEHYRLLDQLYQHATTKHLDSMEQLEAELSKLLLKRL